MKEIILLIKKTIINSEKIVLFHHKNPDGDSLSCSYAFLKVLKKAFPKKTIKWVANCDYIQKRFNFLQIDFEDVIDETEIDKTWLAILGDTSVKEMVYGVQAFENAGKQIIFDHHKNITNLKYDVFWHEPTYNASAMQAYEIVKTFDVNLDSRLSCLLLFGIITDTNRFLYSLANTKPIQLAKELFKNINDKDLDFMYLNLNLKTKKGIAFRSWVLNNIQYYQEEVAYVVIKKSTLDELKISHNDACLVNHIANIENIKAWIFFVEYPEGIRVEFRSLGVHVNEVATFFGGGGHIRASGCFIPKTKNESHWDFVTKIVQKTWEKTQIKSSYEAVLDAISESKNITILTHINPDGDTLFTAKALKALIEINFNNKKIKISTDHPPIFLKTLFGKNYERVNDDFFNNSLKIVVDTSTKNRIFDQRVITKEAIKLDHHFEEGEWLESIGGDFWPATSEILYEMIKTLKLKVNDEIKEAIFIALSTDTSNFKERNISWMTWDILKWSNCSLEAYNYIFELPKHIKFICDKMRDNTKLINGFYFSQLDRQLPNFDYYRLVVDYLRNIFNDKPLIVCVINDKNQIKCGLRNKENEINANDFAKIFAGGGHITSSGFKLEKDISINVLIDFIKNFKWEK